MRYSSVLTAMLFAVTAAMGAKVSSYLQPQTATVGDPLELIVQFEGLDNRPLQSRALGGEGFELLEIDSSSFALKQNLIFKYAIFDTGKYDSPELEFVLGQGADAETLRTEVHQAEIRSTLADTISTIQANKGNWEPAFSLWDEVVEKARWVVPVLVLIGLAVGLWWWIKRRRALKDGTYAEPEIILPAHEIAVTQLIALRDKKYPERGMLKEFFSEFSEIIRRYIENRYGFPALEMTTYELEYKFDAPDFPALLQQRLLPALRESDLVKFAKYIPDPATCKQQLELGFEVVDATREREEQTPEAAAA
ncbi:hypothetical protein KKC97_01975 [bacterium]|nr:hypothetical protein [bacterium]MBU1919841.1 hypothetical protein [bacterium]